MDLFAGEAGVSKAAERLGYRAKFWDIIHGINHDLTRGAVKKRIFRELRRGKVLAVMMAPVCTSFSVARDRTQVIRNRQFPYGIPARFLSEKDQQKIQLGNEVFMTVYEVALLCVALGIPFIIENPLSSKAWYLPEMEHLLSLQCCSFVHTDFCMWGTPWKKPTGLLCGHLDSCDLARLSKVCKSEVRGQCGRTGKAHFQLTGTCAARGIPWTRVAQPYPKQLCTSLAYTLTAPYHTLP